MKLTPAQQLNAPFLGIDPDYYEAADKILATRQTQNMASRYKAPHAYRSTPPKPRYERKPPHRLFKGHRP